MSHLLGKSSGVVQRELFLDKQGLSYHCRKRQGFWNWVPGARDKDQLCSIMPRASFCSMGATKGLTALLAWSSRELTNQI